MGDRLGTPGAVGFFFFNASSSYARARKTNTEYKDVDRVVYHKVYQYGPRNVKSIMYKLAK